MLGIKLKLGCLKKIGLLVIILATSNCCRSNVVDNDDLDRSEVYDAQSYKNENDIDSVFVLYWNAWGCNYDQYAISYSFVTEKMVVFVDYVKNCPMYCIDSSEQMDLFISSINAFYLKKTIPIIVKKIKRDTDEHVEYDIPTFHVECYKNGKRTISSITRLENGDYELVFNSKFEEFKNMIFSVVDEFDKYMDNSRKVNVPYRCRYF